MKSQSGYLTSVIVTYVLIVIVVAAVIFGMVVSGQRDSMVEAAQASLEKMKEEAEAALTPGEAVVCTDALVSEEVLANDFLSLTIKPILKDLGDTDAGYSPGLYINSRREDDGNDTFVTAKRLLQAVKEEDDGRVREFYNEEDRVEFFVLISDKVSCVDQSQMAGTANAGS